MPRATPIYSAFGIVSIESLWPSSNGDEVPINYLDLSFLRERLFPLENPGFSETQADLNVDKGRWEEALERNNASLLDVLNNSNVFQFSSRETFSFSLIEFDETTSASVSRNIRVREFSSEKKTFQNLQTAVRDILDIIASNESLLENMEKGSLTVDNLKKQLSSVIIENKVGFEDEDELKSFHDAYTNRLKDEIRKLKNLTQREEFKSASALENALRYANARILDPDTYGIYPEATIRPGFSSILKSDDAFKKRRGYFKILPLNITSISCNSSTGEEVGNSKFDVIFTLDDVIVIADEFASEMIYNSMPRAIPISLATVEDEIRSIYNQQLPEEIKTELSPYGFTAFRVSGNDFPFNIEDIVEANDTVTIWLYHDPKEFDFVGNEELSLDEFVFNKDFSYVIGTASRKSQDDFNVRAEGEIDSYTPPKTRIQSILTDSGILSTYNSPSQLQNVNFRNNIKLSSSEVFEFLLSAGDEINFTGTRGIANEENTQGVTEGSFSAELALDSISDLIIPNVNGSFLRNALKDNVNLIYFGSKSVTQNDVNLKKDASVAFINSVRETLRETNSETPAAQYAYWEKTYANQAVGRQGKALSTLYTPEDVKSFFEFLNVFNSTVTGLTKNSLSFLASQNVVEIKDATSVSPIIDGKFYKRKVLISRSHGETPYLALKGHISSISTKYGASSGSNLVVIQGNGYEKILNENTVYYEDLFSPTGGAYAQAVEGYPLYSQMLPPRAMLHFIEMHAPRFLLIGKPSGRYIDTKNMSLYLALNSSQKIKQEKDSAEGLNTNEITESKNIWERYFDDDKILLRGLAAVDINTSGDVTDLRIDETDTDDVYTASVRIFYPVNYINTSRIREMINALREAYFENINEATIKIPFKVSSRQSVANNIIGFNGPKEINHLFIDETGRLRQRLAFEAWERPPQPEYTPSIFDEDVLSGGSNFSRNSASITTMVDVRANYQGSATGIVDARFAGRTLSAGSDYIPLTTLENNKLSTTGEESTLFSNNYDAISEPFFRYGMRYKLLNDIYTTSTRVAKRKSALYHGFFSKPIKTATITVKGNPAYRIGETVLVSLNSYRYRSREIVDVNKTLDWLNYLKSNKELIPLYIGADRRWVNHEFYYETTSLNDSPQYSSWLNEEFKANPEEYVLDRFIETFNFLRGKLTGNLKFITAEYFPTTYWAFFDRRSANFENAPSVIPAYNSLYNQLIGRGEPQFKKSINRNANVLRAIRMQNFRAASYYIESVSHDFVHGESFRTTLSLNHGQDNLVLIEPYSMKPIGFMSVERRMRIGYDDKVITKDGQDAYSNESNRNTRDRLLWEEFPSPGNPGKLSDLQRMYIEQFKQDRAFKQSSFLYEAQKTRNSANFMYEISLENNI
jgi:hypothetical protein